MGRWLQTLQPLNKNNNNNPPNKQKTEQTYISNSGSHIISFRKQYKKTNEKGRHVITALVFCNLKSSINAGGKKCLGTLVDVGCLLAQARTTCRATWWWDAGDGSRRPIRSFVHAFVVILSRVETSQRVHKSAWRFTISILSRRKQKKKVATTPSADRKK